MASDFDILGALDDELLGGDDELLGALQRADPELLGARVRRRAQKQQAGRQALMQRFGMRAPGVPAQGGRRMPLGFDSFTFAPAIPTVNPFIARPQVPFKGRRLVVDIVRSAGAGAIAVRVDDIQVGTKSQMAGVLRVTANIFVPTAFDTDLMMDPCTPGIDILVIVSVSAAPGAGESIIVTPTLIGDAVQ